MSLYDIVTGFISSSSKDVNKALGIDPKGGERDEQGNLTPEGEKFFAPIWDEEANQPLEDFYEGRWNENFTKFGTDNPILNPAGQISDPGNFLTSAELSQSKPSDRSATMAAIAALFVGGALGGAGSAAEGGGAAGEAGAVGTGAGAGAEGFTAGEALAAGSETGEGLGTATGASEGYTGGLGDALLQDYGADVVDTAENQRQQQIKAKEDADARARAKIQGNVQRSEAANIAAQDVTVQPETIIPDNSIQYGETPEPIPMVPTPVGEDGPDSVTTVETSDGTTTTVKESGIGTPAQKRSPYGTNDALDSLKNSDSKDFYNDLLGG